MQGSALKVVRCENCSTEYVYVLERQGMGAGVSMYMLNNEGAAENATSGARESLTSALENDFDPVPCPACGHYQRYMFPKLAEGKWPGLQVLMFLVLLCGCLTAAIALYCSAAYLLGPDDHQFRNMVRAWSVLLSLCAAGLGLSLIRRSRLRHFDPNLQDQEARFALARSRAVIRAEFEQARQNRTMAPNGDQGPDPDSN
jgi:hypothetical protein